jgi:HEAT repeat protein
MSRSWAARLWPAAAFQFCFIAAVAMLKPGANALVLSRFNSGALPWLYTSAAVITGGLAILGANANRRVGPFALSLAGAVTAVGCALGVWLKVPLTPLLAYLFSESFATQVSLAFWAALSESFDARESRRAFTWINGIGMSGAIAGGLLAQVLARHEGAVALLVSGGVLLVLGAVAWRFHEASPVLDDGRARQPVTRAPLKEVLARPYTQLLAALVLGLTLLQILIDFVFRERAVAHLVEADMADLFASHQLWTGVFCVVFQLALAEVLLRKLGILRYLGLIPAGLGVLTIATWAIPSVWSAWALKVFEGASSWSLLPVAMQLLYAPIPDGLRDGTRRTVDGFLRKVGMGLAGLVLLGLAHALGSTGVLALVLVLCAAVGWALVKLRPQYIDAVHARVAGVEAGQVFDAEARVLTEALRSPSSERVLRAAELLAHACLLDASHVEVLLAHSHERVQERGVALAEQLGVRTVARQLETMTSMAARRPRDHAIWALARLNPERAAVVLPHLLQAQDIGVQTAAVGGLLSIDEKRFPAAVALLADLMAKGAAAPTADRRELARLLGRLARTDDRTRFLERLLDDGDPSVRRIAIGSVGQSGSVELASRLLRFLSWRDERRFAREALASLGDAVVPLLAVTLDDRSRPLSLRLQLPRVLRAIATQAAFEALLFSNLADDPSLHFRVGTALGRMRDEHPTIEVDRARVMGALQRRRDVIVMLRQPWLDARAAVGETSLLTRVLGDRLDQSLAISFWLLGLLHDGRLLRRAHEHLVGSDLRRRAWALELIDNTLSGEERELIAEQIEPLHTQLPPGDAHGLDRHLELLTFSDDVTLRACARRVARWLGTWKEPAREDDMNEQTLRKLFALEGVEIFAQSDVDDLSAVAAVAREQTYRAGQEIYAEGDPGDALFVIVEGVVDAKREGEVVLTMHARESFGETSLFDGAPRVNSVIATADTRVLAIDRRDFLDLLADRPELLSGMFRVLSRQLKSMVVEVAARRLTTGEMPALHPAAPRQR